MFDFDVGGRLPDSPVISKQLPRIILMKRIAAATALSLALLAAPIAGTANAGGMAPAMEPVVIIDDTSSSGGGILVPVLALILIAAVIH
jgi:hypothetical protein